MIVVAFTITTLVPAEAPTIISVAPVCLVSEIVTVVTVMAVLKTVTPWLPSHRS